MDLKDFIKNTLRNLDEAEAEENVRILGPLNFVVLLDQKGEITDPWEGENMNKVQFAIAYEDPNDRKPKEVRANCIECQKPIDLQADEFIKIDNSPGKFARHYHKNCYENQKDN